jgi:hypothetical protein
MEEYMRKFINLTIMGLLIILTVNGCTVQVFNGSRTGDNNQFIMNYTVLSRSETHEMKLEEGSTIDVDIENKSGRLDILVEDINGEVIYKGNNVSTGEFSIVIPKTNNYIITVSGKKAIGSVAFKVVE